MDKIQRLVDIVDGNIGVLVIYDKKTQNLFLYRDDSRELVLSSEDRIKDLDMEEVMKITGFYNSQRLAYRYIEPEKLKMVEPYTVIEIDTNGYLLDIYDLKKPKSYVESYRYHNDDLLPWIAESQKTLI